MKKISKQAVRDQAVNSVLASLRIENLTPSEYVIEGLNACMREQETTTNLLQEVKRRHVTLRRH